MSFALHGLAVSNGIAIGHAHLISHATLEVEHYVLPGRFIEEEVERFDEAVAKVQAGLDAVAVCGTALSDEHADTLRRLRRPLIYVPHTDESGIGFDAVSRWKESVGRGEIVRLPDDIKDLNSLKQRADYQAWLKNLRHSRIESAYCV